MHPHDFCLRKRSSLLAKDIINKPKNWDLPKLSPLNQIIIVNRVSVNGKVCNNIFVNMGRGRWEVPFQGTETVIVSDCLDKLSQWQKTSVNASKYDPSPTPSMQNTGKLLAICLVFVFTCYHGLYLARNGVTPCKGLFKHGMVKGDGETWQPWGCMMHTYTKTWVSTQKVTKKWAPLILKIISCIQVRVLKGIVDLRICSVANASISIAANARKVACTRCVNVKCSHSHRAYSLV